MGYGLLTETDVCVLEGTLRKTIEYFGAAPVIRVVEIGVCHGDTARGIAEFVRGYGRDVAYWGVDSGRDKAVTAPFAGAQLILGDSAETYISAPDNIHFLLVDGCHCANHVMLDFLNWGDKVVPGGAVCFHDVNPRAQGKLDYQGHGPANHPDFGTASREALRKLGLLTNQRRDWVLEAVEYDGQDWGGVLAVRKG